jgi:hypothetical protein
MSKFTKGEWIINRNSIIAGNQHIAEVWTKGVGNITEEESKANAKLITAAPEMLEMLKDILETVRECETPRLYEIEELIDKICI